MKPDSVGSRRDSRVVRTSQPFQDFSNDPRSQKTRASSIKPAEGSPEADSLKNLKQEVEANSINRKAFSRLAKYDLLLNESRKQVRLSQLMT